MTKQMGAVPFNREDWRDAARQSDRQMGGNDIMQGQMGDNHGRYAPPGSYRDLRDSWPEEGSRQMVHTFDCTQQMG